MRKILILAVPVLALVACDNGTEPGALGPEGALLSSSPVACQAAGATGQTAVYVNQSVIGVTIDFADLGCDMAIYFDADAPKNAVVRNTTVIQETGSGGIVMGLWNSGADVTVTNSLFTTDVTGQYIPIRFDAGAAGTISGNELSGNHRAGILIRGAGTDVVVRNNTVTGSGAKTSGWAENGIQVDQQATARVTNNTFEGHWWDGAGNWASSAILVWGADGLDVTNNVLVDNEFSIYLYESDGSTVTGNRTSSEVVSQAFRAWGVLMLGADNHIGGNRITAVNGAGGIYLFPGSEGNTFTGNRIEGFAWPIVDGGDETVIRGKPTPVF
jgi:parallel beta-helix repeat protein